MSRCRAAPTAAALPLLNVLTTSDAQVVPSHVRLEDARGFAFSLGKMVLAGGVGDVVEIVRRNVRNLSPALSRTNSRTIRNECAFRA